MSGRRLAKALEKAFGYNRVHQVGSHIILQADTPRRHRICVPDHKILRIGTLNAVLRCVSEAQGLTKENILTQLSK